jgi:hypothetical protein
MANLINRICSSTGRMYMRTLIFLRRQFWHRGFDIGRGAMVPFSVCGQQMRMMQVAMQDRDELIRFG